MFAKYRDALFGSANYVGLTVYIYLTWKNNVDILLKKEVNPNTTRKSQNCTRNRKNASQPKPNPSRSKKVEVTPTRNLTAIEKLLRLPDPIQTAGRVECG